MSRARFEVSLQGLVVGLAFVGCVSACGAGTIEEPVPGNGPGAANGPGGGGSGSGEVGSTPGDPRIAQRIWRLSATEVDEEVTRLFGEGAPALKLPPSAAEFGIGNIASKAVIDQGNASLFADGMRAVANWVVQGGATRARCTTYGDDACVDALLDWLPSAAFRRPATSAETAALRKLFDDLHASYEYDYALAGVIRAVLLSPEFLYRTELNTVLSSDEIATLLAFAITGAAPDAELLEAAKTEDFSQPDVRELHARRLMDDSEKVWQRFFWEWLHLATLHSQGIELSLSPQLVDQMEEEYRAFVREVVVEQRGTLGDVLSAPYTWAQPELAAHYGASHPGNGLQRIELDPTQRGGLLTQGAWLVSHGKDGHDNVVRRGMNIFKDAMCNNKLSPPDGVDVLAELAKLVGPNATVRETVDARAGTSPCSGCHALPDPIGMVFESYTSDGRWQETYADGAPVETDVSIAQLGDFDNAPKLAQTLAQDETLQRCFVRRFAHMLVGIDLGAPKMVAWTEQAYQRLADTDGDLEEMLVALVTHPAFIERRTENAP